MEKGYSKGHSDGIEKGTEQKAIEIAHNMLNENTPIDFISKVTGLPISSIDKLK